MKAKQEDFVVVCVTDSWGFTEKNYPQIQNIIDRSNPDFYSVALPSPILVFFLANKDGESRANALLEAINELIHNNPIYSLTSTGKSIGSLIARFDRHGTVKTEPLGIAINQAMDAARRP